MAGTTVMLEEIEQFGLAFAIRCRDNSGTHAEQQAEKERSIVALLHCGTWLSMIYRLCP
jgi:hypothetical protein